MAVIRKTKIKSVKRKVGAIARADLQKYFSKNTTKKITGIINKK